MLKLYPFSSILEEKTSGFASYTWGSIWIFVKQNRVPFTKQVTL
jgi:hypothetical protein